MHAIADTDRLVADGVLTPDQARVIESRAREAMIVLAINSILCFGILAATGGLIFLLANAMAVAICGTLLLAGGSLILSRGGEMFRIFGNAAALIGAGMLIGGAALELLDKFEQVAGSAMTVGGGAIAGVAAGIYRRPGHRAGFVTGAILLMGLVAHIAGLALLLDRHDIHGLPVSLFYLYCAAIIAGAGWLIDVRLVSALSVAPFAQMLDTGTNYFHAMYVFYSPEPTLSILQMSALIAVCLWIASKTPERTARHARVIAILAFVVANLCALVASIWGDVVGETLWGPGRYGDSELDWDAYEAAREAFRASALVISDAVYSALWAIALAAMILWGAVRNQRGLFNAALTFAAIHAYTQLFESFADEPLAYVIGGFAAVPLAWGLWRLNHWMAERAAPLDERGRQ